MEPYKCAHDSHNFQSVVTHNPAPDDVLIFCTKCGETRRIEVTKEAGTN